MGDGDVGVETTKGWMVGGWRVGWRGCGAGGSVGLVDGGWMEGWMEGGGLVAEGVQRVGWRGVGLGAGWLDGGGGGWMEAGRRGGGMGFLNRSEPNRKKNRTEPREPKLSRNPS